MKNLTSVTSVLLREYMLWFHQENEDQVRCYLQKSQKQNKIAKTRILIEQVIRRLKVFRFIANEVPINMLSYIDDILQICAAISNM